jgi:P-type Cu+ transporter
MLDEPPNTTAPASSEPAERELPEGVLYYSFAAFVGILLLLNWLGVFKTVFGIDTAILITLLAGYKTFYNSLSALLERRISADIALCVAVIAALATGNYLAAAEAMFIVLIGEGLESYASGRTAAAIKNFVEELPRTATILRDGSEEIIKAELLVPGDLILVRAGERIPADGVIESGYSHIDESSITGESVPQDKKPGDEVLSGTLNGNAALTVRVSRSGSETTISQVIALVQEAQERKSPVERLADRYAQYFLPALLLSAALTFYFTRDWSRTVAVLIVACPCALILATPTAMVAAIGGLARRGILVRGPAVLERAAKVNTLLFDKTGTITEGRFQIRQIIAVNHSEDDVLTLAAAAERSSHHPLAQIIVGETLRRGLSLIDPDAAEVLPGQGVCCRIGNREIYAGSATYLERIGVRGTDSLLSAADAAGSTAVLVAEGQTLVGAILLRDRLREGVSAALGKLRELGLTDQRLLTGDNRRTAEVIAREAGITEVEADLLPAQKVEAVKALIKSGRHPVMIGEGLNDAAALASADVGVAVSGASDITAEAADVVYLPESLENLPAFFLMSRKAIRTAWQNIILFAGVVNASAVVLAATGKLGPVSAAVTHQLSSFFVMLNSLRLLRAPGRSKSTWWKEHMRAVVPAQLSLEKLSQRVNQFAGHLEFDALANSFLRSWPRLRRPLLSSAAALYVLSGIYTLRPDETGIIEHFGRKIVPYSGPGLHYKIPWPVDRLTRLQTNLVRTVEIGFRSNPKSSVAVEPSAYEWNAQHRTGRYTSVPEEASMLTGDQNMIELTATVFYRAERPDSYLFRQLDADATVRSASASVVENIVTAASLDEVLTLDRRAIEARARAVLQGRLDRYDSGIRVLQVKLEDVHPSQEVVDAFRKVSDAFEEKSRLINEAEGYRNEQLAVSRGNAKAMLKSAEAYRIQRQTRAQGDAARFQLAETAFRSASAATENRLYLETLEEVLPGKKKLILDKSQGKRHLLLLEDGVELPPNLGSAR